jgi:hypothetical protein
MKTVLKDLKTGLLFRNMDEWTSSLDQAASFRDTVAALKFCQHSNLDSIAIIQAFENGAASRIAGFHGRHKRSPNPGAPANPAKAYGKATTTITISLKEKAQQTVNPKLAN